MGSMHTCASEHYDGLKTLGFGPQQHLKHNDLH